MLQSHLDELGDAVGDLCLATRDFSTTVGDLEHVPLPLSLLKYIPDGYHRCNQRLEIRRCGLNHSIS